MLISEWLQATQDPNTYKALLAFAAKHNMLCLKAKLAYYRVFHFHPHQHPDLVQIIHEENPLEPQHPVAQRVARRESESETVLARTLVEIPAAGATQDIPMTSEWFGYGDVRIIVRRRVRWK